MLFRSVKSRFLLNEILAFPPGDYEVTVNQRSLSQLKGQQKRNIYFLMENGYNIKITVSDSIPVGKLKIKKR